MATTLPNPSTTIPDRVVGKGPYTLTVTGLLGHLGHRKVIAGFDNATAAHDYARRMAAYRFSIEMPDGTSVAHDLGGGPLGGAR